jgi:hypothetical protein
MVPPPSPSLFLRFPLLSFCCKSCVQTQPFLVIYQRVAGMRGLTGQISTGCATAATARARLISSCAAANSACTWIGMRWMLLSTKGHMPGEAAQGAREADHELRAQACKMQTPFPTAMDAKERSGW